MNPAILRAVAYAAVTILGLIAAALAAMGFGDYSADTGLYTITVDVKVAATYLVGLIGGPGVALTAVLKGWKPVE